MGVAKIWYLLTRHSLLADSTTRFECNNSAYEVPLCSLCALLTPLHTPRCASLDLQYYLTRSLSRFRVRLSVAFLILDTRFGEAHNTTYTVQGQISQSESLNVDVDRIKIVDRRRWIAAKIKLTEQETRPNFGAHWALGTATIPKRT